jgi:two-component system response regulator ChvI
MKKILIVDDEIEILKPLEEMLIEEGFSVRSVDNPLKALDLIRQYQFDLSIFDIKMPEMSGLDLISEARKIAPSLPVIFLSSKNDDIDAVVGMTAGADDYVGKPFTKQLLLLRIKSVLRRHSTNEVAVQRPIKVGDLSIDIDRHLVKWKDESIDFTVTECLLLISLAERPGIVKKRQQLIESCYDGTYVSDRTVDSHVRNIRAKFKDLDKEADIIGTVQGLGYKLKL